MTARRKTSPAQALTRRRFVTMVAAGSAVLLAKPELASAATAPRRKSHAGAAARPAPATPIKSAAQKEFDRQHAGTLATLKTLRDQPLPPGGDLPVVFRPQRTRMRDR
jgi:hypothetical protein